MAWGNALSDLTDVQTGHDGAHRAIPCLANITGCFVDACPAPHTCCVQPGRFTGKTLEPLCYVGTAPGDTFTEHLGARCISGTRSLKCRQPSFTTPQLGIASSQLTVSLTSRWKNCLYSPLQGVFCGLHGTPGSPTCIYIWGKWHWGSAPHDDSLWSS